LEVTHATSDLVNAGSMASGHEDLDVSGGHGHLVSTIMQRYPGMNAVVFDQPHVVAGAEAVLAEAGVGDQVELAGGDFFDSVPAGDDAYVLSMTSPTSVIVATPVSD
ncbi:MAG TPA: methyltransferase, partial [Pseudonocardiaceae bacterium]|nr:methyltransferase [Pseudonocardiaceae bacterium]